MQEKYTENIDKLDYFYQDSLQGVSIEPPTAMWDKIHTSYQEQKKTKGLFKKRTLLLSLLFLLFISACITLYLYNKKEPVKTPDNNPSNNYQTPTNASAPILQGESNKEKTTNTDNKANSKMQTNNSFPIETNTKKITDSTVLVTPMEEPVKLTVEETRQKTDTVSTPVIIPKKKMNFREKHTQNIKQDSLRPLFVPVK